MLTASFLTACLSIFLTGFLYPLVRDWALGSQTEQTVRKKVEDENQAKLAADRQKLQDAQVESDKAHAGSSDDSGYLQEFKGKDP